MLITSIIHLLDFDLYSVKKRFFKLLAGFEVSLKLMWFDVFFSSQDDLFESLG